MRDHHAAGDGCGNAGKRAVRASSHSYWHHGNGHCRKEARIRFAELLLGHARGAHRLAARKQMPRIPLSPPPTHTITRWRSAIRTAALPKHPWSGRRRVRFSAAGMKNEADATGTGVIPSAALAVTTIAGGGADVP